MVKRLDRTGMLSLQLTEDSRNMLEAALRLYFVLEGYEMSNKEYFLSLETLLRFHRLTAKGWVKLTRSQFFLLSSDEVLKYIDEPTRYIVISELQYVERRPDLPHPDIALSEFFDIEDYFFAPTEIEMPQPAVV